MTFLFKDVLKTKRLAVCLTQKQLSEKTGIALSNIKNWERGNYLPSGEHWETLYNFFLIEATAHDLQQAYLKEKVYGRDTNG